jgi:YrbI family 3-deoxy-D-manno-octulosonate 8-phosphate phosphatase
MKKELIKKLNTVKLFLFDLEGVLIKDGETESASSLNDFIELIKSYTLTLKNKNVAFGIVTGREDDFLINSLRKIEGLILISSTLDKAEAVDNLLPELNLSYQDVFYMGDDILDIPLLSKCGAKAAPRNAKREVKRVVDIIVDAENSKELLKEIFSSLNKKN